ncbi:MAG: prepilin-type N-terminal cleavage/methylation domain-containing protein [Candidatus Aminicenantes bacterium]|nr:prepilin-type N-terminal cleavage/methylation domain-containing protein [Candidatus Aminicenantes bacterium]
MKHEEDLEIVLASKKGFTLIEVLISLMLVALALISTARTIIFAMEEYRKSVLRFSMMQALQDHKDTLTGKPFDSGDLAAGSYEKKEGKFELTWVIQSLSADLKKIGLSISYSIFSKKIYFYKSKFINNQGEKK